MFQNESKCSHMHTVKLTVRPSRMTRTGYIAGSQEKVVLCLDCEQVIPVKQADELEKVIR